MTPDFSVVILHYNTPVFLEGALDSVVRAVQERNAEIIVADNASPDFDVDDFRRRFPQVKFIVHPENYGFARGNNLAVEAARGRRIFLLNPDVLVPEPLFDRMNACMDGLNKPGLCSVRLIDGHGRYLPESKRRVPTLTGIAGKMLSRKAGDFWSGGYYDRRLANTADGPAEVFVGALLGFEREAYLRLGGLDEDFFMYGEDIDLSVRFLRAGLTNYYLGSSAAVHFKGESTPRDPVYRRHFTRAAEIYMQKHHPTAYRLTAPLMQPLLNRWSARKTKHIPSAQTAELPPAYIGDRPQVHSRLERHFGTKVPVYSMEKLPGGPHLLILDPDTYGFETLIGLLEQQAGSAHRFRWLTLDGKKYYGSDSATAKGEVVILEK